MFGGHPGFPAIAQDHTSALPQLQLFGEYPVGCTIDNVNFVGNEHITGSSRPVKRAREPGPIATPQKLHISLNTNFGQDDAGLTRTMNLNPVSTGLRLSYEEDERNSSVTSGSENMKALDPFNHSLANGIKIEIDRQKELLDRYLKVQEENFAKGMRELNKRHTGSLLNALEKEIAQRLSEKEKEINTLNKKNMELDFKIKQVAMEAQSWHHRAKYNESMVNALKVNLQKVIAQGPAQKEGYGDSEVDDAASHMNVEPSGSLKCKACSDNKVCVLLLPCKHLCLCKDCEMVTGVCPVCGVTRSASFEVFMS